MEDALHHLLTVVLTLLCVDVEHLSLIIRECSRVAQHLTVGECCRYDCRDIEGFLALGFTCRCAEVAKSADGGAIHLKDLRWNGVLIGGFQSDGLPDYPKLTLG